MKLALWRAAGAVRLFVAAAIVLAVFLQYFHGLPLRAADPERFTADYFSFFTIHSNLFAAIALAIAGVRALRRPREHESVGFSLVRACSLTYIVTTGLVYNLLLRGTGDSGGTVLPFANEIMHVAAPLYLVIDWLVVHDRVRIPWRYLWVVATYPLAWTVFTLVRAAFIGWYPYPFLDPATAGGESGVALYIVAITFVVMGLGAVVFTVTRLPQSAGITPPHVGMV